jgi:hypothetical protein
MIRKRDKKEKASTVSEITAHIEIKNCIVALIIYKVTHDNCIERAEGKADSKYDKARNETKAWWIKCVEHSKGTAVKFILFLAHCSRRRRFPPEYTHHGPA